MRQLLIDPGGLADRRVGEAVAERLRPRALDPGVARAAVAVRRQPRQGGLLLGARLALEGWREEDWKVQVNGLQALHMLLRHPGGHARPPVAALGDIAGVAQSIHELRPRLGNMRNAPAAGGGLVGEAVAGERRGDHVEGVFGLSAVRRRIGQRAQNLEEFHHRSRPPVGHDDRQGVRVLRFHVQEVNPQPVDLRAELRDGVQPLLQAAHVVGGSPVIGERLHLL